MIIKIDNRFTLGDYNKIYKSVVHTDCIIGLPWVITYIRIDNRFSSVDYNRIDKSLPWAIATG